MNEKTLETFTRRAATVVSRRVSLLTLGSAGLVALAGPITAEAKKNGKNKKKNSNKKKRKSAGNVTSQCQQDLEDCSAQATLCAGQVGPCAATLSNTCDDDDPACPEQATACCQYLATCDVTAFFACLVAAGI
jgi:hypothetical protein